eukprot:scaffold1543_cov162-Pinguiococcus_pyrenoidosus.AAC.1
MAEEKKLADPPGHDKCRPSRLFSSLLRNNDMAEEAKLTKPGAADKLWNAIRDRNTDVVRKILEDNQHNQSLIEAQDGSGLTPLAYAYQNGIYDLYDLLESKGAKLDELSKAGWTPLQVAAWKGDTDQVENLITEERNVQARNTNGSTALNTPAALNGQPEEKQGLLSPGANDEAATENVWTPLHLAAAKGHKG